jgi:ABC-type branched-subunit amino acid transport system ATPase component
MVVVSMFADVQRGEVESEGRDGPADPCERTVGREGCGVVPQRVFQQLEVVDELGCGDVVPAVLVY